MKRPLVPRIGRAIKLVVFNLLARSLQYAIPKKDTRWAFAIIEGTRFYGNAYYLFLYLAKHHPEIETVVYVNTPSLKERVLAANPETLTCAANSWMGLWHGLRSKVFFSTFEMMNDFLLSHKHKNLKANLWHGVPLKAIRYGSSKRREAIENLSLKSKIYSCLAGHVRLQDYDFIPYTSPRYKEIMEAAFRNPHVFLTGQPADDAFYLGLSKQDVLEKYGLGEFAEKKIVLYLPTFRDHSKTFGNYSMFQGQEEHYRTLRDNNMVVFQKFHPSVSAQGESNDVVVNLSQEIETQELLAIADILITDYSSCYIDYLHTQRPIVFFPFDIDDYMKYDREFYWDYYEDQITPGRKAMNEEELLSALLTYANHPDEDAEIRAKSRDYFHTFQDGKASERVTNQILELLA